MKQDLIGNIGGLTFVTGDVAFGEAAKAWRKGEFGKNIKKKPSFSSVKKKGKVLLIEARN